MKTLHKRWSFPLRISSVNVTNSAKKTYLCLTFIFYQKHFKAFYFPVTKYTSGNEMLLNVKNGEMVNGEWCIMFFCCTPDPVKKKTQQNVVGTEIYLVFTNSSTANILITSSNQSLHGALIVLLEECIIPTSLNSDSHLPKQSFLFTSTKGLQKWWRMLFILS